MLVSCNWLREFVPQLPAPAKLEQILTDIGLEVEASHIAGPELDNVVAGIILADGKRTSNQVCSVDIGRERPLQIVCTAPNATKNKRVAVALVGAQILGHTIASREIKGVVSEGMMCSAAELRLGDDRKLIIELERDVRPGTPLGTLLETDDHVFDVAVTPNRGDWLSMLGIGRELAAKSTLKLRGVHAASPIKRTDATAIHQVRIDESAARACPKFACLPISNVNANAHTPALICQRLLRCGVRPVSIIVDLTNYVMLELGQPLHAFDRNRLSGDLAVRMGREGEKLELIDKTIAKLSDRYLVVADDAQAQAIGGVMGGMASSITAATTDILLEAAHFTPATIRGRTRELNISSEAAFRFERGVNPNLCEIALWRAARLIKRYCGGTVGSLNVAGATPQAAEAVKLEHGQIKKLTGMAVSLSEAARRLKALGFNISRQRKTLTTVSPPWRFDIERKEDLIEEIIRFGGYSSLPTTMPQLTGTFVAAPQRLIDATMARDRLAHDGYQEIITYAFVRPHWEQDFYANNQPFVLTNPLSEELSAMRSGLFGGLIDRAIYNQRRRQESLRLFEIGRCFNAKDDTQPLLIGGLGWGKVGNALWDDQKHNYDFFDARGSLTRLLPGDELELETLQDHPALHPGRAATILRYGKQIGIVGELHPALLDKHRYPLDPAPVVFELDLDLLINQVRNFAFEPFGKLPLVRRDLAVIVDNQTTAAQLVKSVAGVKVKGFPEIAEIQVFDNFSGGNIISGKRSMGIRITMQGNEENMVEDRINEIMLAITNQLQNDYQAEVRI